MTLKVLALVILAVAALAGPATLQKYRQISEGETLRREIVSELLNERTFTKVLQDSRVRGIVNYGYFSGNSLAKNGLQRYLESGSADFDADFWAVLSVHDLRSQLDIPVEERNLPRERKTYLWQKGLCAGTHCRYESAKLIEVPKESWKDYELKLVETSYNVRRSGFEYLISLNVLVDRDSNAVTVTLSVLRNALNPFDRALGELFASQPPDFWYSSFSTSIDLFTKEVATFR